MDGTPTARMCNEVSLALIEGKLPDESGGASTALPEVVPLPFEVDDKAQKFIDQAMSDHQAAVQANSLNYLSYQAYGKDQIKAQKTGPDSW
jgi:hypothetical protein